MITILNGHKADCDKSLIELLFANHAIGKTRSYIVKKAYLLDMQQIPKIMIYHLSLTVGLLVICCRKLKCNTYFLYRVPK